MKIVNITLFVSDINKYKLMMEQRNQVDESDDTETDNAEDVMYESTSNAEDYCEEQNSFSVQDMKIEFVHRYIDDAKQICCDKGCYRKCNHEEMLNIFKTRSKIEQKNTILKYLTTQQLIVKDGSDNTVFHFEGETFCMKSFSQLTGVSTYILSTVRSDFMDGRTLMYVHGNCWKGRMTNASIGFVSWMKNFASRFGQDSPDEKLIILPR